MGKYIQKKYNGLKHMFKVISSLFTLLLGILELATGLSV
jgi:hypothetical protein